MNALHISVPNFTLIVKAKHDYTILEPKHPQFSERPQPTAEHYFFCAYLADTKV